MRPGALLAGPVAGLRCAGLAAGLAAGGLSGLPFAPVAGARAQASPLAPDASEQAAAPAVTRPEALFRERLAALRSTWLGTPHFLVLARIASDGTVTRARLHLRGPGHWLLQLTGDPWRQGTTFLLYRGQLHAWFPRAGLQLRADGAALQGLLARAAEQSTPASATAGGTAVEASPAQALLAALDDLATVLDPARAEVAGTQPDEAGERIALLFLPTRGGQDLPDGQVPPARRLLLDVRTGAPLRLETRDADGRTLRALDFLDPGTDGWPRRLALRSDGTSSELRVLLAEAEAETDPARFLPEAITTWR